MVDLEELEEEKEGDEFGGAERRARKAHGFAWVGPVVPIAIKAARKWGPTIATKAGKILKMRIKL